MKPVLPINILLIFIAIVIASCNVVIYPNPRMVVLDGSYNTVYNSCSVVDFGDVRLGDSTSDNFTLIKTGNTSFRLTNDPKIIVQDETGTDALKDVSFPGG